MAKSVGNGCRHGRTCTSDVAGKSRSGPDDQIGQTWRYMRAFSNDLPMPSYRDNRHMIYARVCISDRKHRIGGCLSITILRSEGGERVAMELSQDLGEFSE